MSSEIAATEVTVNPVSESAPPSKDTPAIRVRKRNGTLEVTDIRKIIRAVSRCCDGLPDVDPMRVASKTINGVYDGTSSRELDLLSIQTAASLTVEDPQYAKLAARLLSEYVSKEVRGQGVQTFSQSVSVAHSLEMANDRLLKFVSDNSRKLDDAIRLSRDDEFEYFGLQTVYDRYLLRHPKTRMVIETPQQFFMRIACALSDKVSDALELYKAFSTFEYMPSSPTLFNSGTMHEQLSSCFLLDSPEDSLDAIYSRYTDVARLSKFSGGIGISYSRVRSRGSHIKGTNGISNGIVPWLKTRDASVAAVSQGSKRKGACCVYLETWHPDIMEFLELRDNTGDEARRTHNLNVANWIPDLFMQRLNDDKDWSLFDPKVLPQLTDLYGDEFKAVYEKAEADGLASKVVKARELYARMIRTLAQTGNGWMCFKDKSNSACNQTALPGRAVHLSNLCTEILELTSQEETAVCNLGSINVGRHVKDGKFDFEKLAKTVRVAVRQLDRVIDINYYSIPSARGSNTKWRPVGLGLMGLQDVFFQLKLPFDSQEARDLSRQISEEIYYNALSASSDLAQEKGAHPGFPETRAARGELQFDAWGVKPSGERWAFLREKVKRVGLRNSLLIAIAPTATIASIVGCYECIEPQVSNLFKRETMSGDFIQVNKYLVADLKRLGLWGEATRSRLKLSEGSVAAMLDIPADLRAVYRTAWEMSMRGLIDMAADRGAFIDQSQSLNLFVESPNIGPLSSMYNYAWQRGLKTTYYLRSRPATKIAKATVDTSIPPPSPVEDVAAVVCSLENPTSCEACQ